MAFQELFLFLMIAGNSLAASGRWNSLGIEDKENSISLRQSAINYNCPGSGAQGCISCSSFPYCLGVGTTAYNITCSSSQVCQNVNGIGQCLPYTDSVVSDCKCGGGSFIDDSYETTGNRYLQCLEGCAPIPKFCSIGLKFDFFTEKCSATATTVPVICTQPGYFLLGCRQGYACPSPGFTPYVSKCDANQFYDLNGNFCVSEANVKLPSFSCPSGGSGAFADTLECNAFYICSSGIVLGSKICCSAGQMFSSITMTCTFDTSVVTCPVKHPCDTSSYTYRCSSSTITTNNVVNPVATTTPVSSKCVEVLPTCTTYGAYPNPCNCKEYYWCAGGKPTKQYCPTQLVFDSKTRYCTKVADSNGCA